jgi:hypothetical protein
MADNKHHGKKAPRFTFLNRTRDAKGKTVKLTPISRRRNKKGKR